MTQHEVEPAADRDTLVREMGSGYVVVRGLLPPDEVTRVRAGVAGVYDSHGWLAPGTDPGLLRPDGRRRDGAPGWWRFAEDIQRLESFHRLAHHPALTGLADRLVGEKVLHHGRRHLTIVNPEFWVPPHQEWTYIQGAVDTYTAFVPLTPIGGDGGATLRVLEESGPRALRPLHLLPTRGVEAKVGSGEGSWVDLALEPGDAVILHSLTTREVTENTTDSIRLAALYRFQARKAPVVKASIKPEHYPRLPDWPTITKGWSTRKWVQPPMLPKLVDYRMPPTVETWHEVLPAPESAVLPTRPAA